MKRLEIIEKRLEDAQKLWAHCVSEHAVVMAPDTPLEDLIEYHKSEHQGPGTIRDHDEASRVFDLKKIGQVLSEQ